MPKIRKRISSGIVEKRLIVCRFFPVSFRLVCVAFVSFVAAMLELVRIRFIERCFDTSHRPWSPFPGPSLSLYFDCHSSGSGPVRLFRLKGAAVLADRLVCIFAAKRVEIRESEMMVVVVSILVRPNREIVQGRSVIMKSFVIGIVYSYGSNLRFLVRPLEMHRTVRSAFSRRLGVRLFCSLFVFPSDVEDRVHVER